MRAPVRDGRKPSRTDLAVRRRLSRSIFNVRPPRVPDVEHQVRVRASVPADAVTESELQEVRLADLDRADGERTPEMIREVEARAVTLIEARDLLVVEAAPHGVAKLEEDAEARNDVLVAAVEPQR